ncbi:MAG: repressor LexA [Rhodothermales bacterium]|nr:repressor LexA [Rhodothermales bacterium]
MSRRDLTPKQKAFFGYLKSFIADNGSWPTYREIVDYFDFRSPNSVTQNLQALLKKGYLIRDGLGYALASRQSNDNFGIPVRGIITAGALQEAVEADLGTISLETIFPQLDRMYAIRVSGQSMTGADIQDGDYVLLIDDDIPDGGIGAVLYDGETSLKRIFRGDRGLRLEPANPEYDDIIIEPDIFEEVRVLGRYVGHVNRNGVYKRTSRSVAA